MNTSRSIGIDIGATGTAIGIVDAAGKILHKDELVTTDYPDVGSFVHAVHQSVTGMLGISPDSSSIAGCGVGAPNANYRTGEIVQAPNLPWKGVVPLRQLLADQLGMKVAITNDANAAAWGELKFGLAKDMRDFVMVTLGTGLGSGVIANKQLVYGRNGFAGELGHVNAVPGGRMCGCGKKGCLEMYVSATGVVRTAEEWKGKIPAADRSKYERPDLHSGDVYKYAMEGDVTAQKIFDYTAGILGRALADVVMITAPEAFIFCGGLAAAGELLFHPAKQYMEASLMPVFRNQVSLLHSALPDAEIAILGAASLVWD